MPLAKRKPIDAPEKLPLEQVAEAMAAHAKTPGTETGIPASTKAPASSMHAFEADLNETKQDDFAPFSVSALGLAFDTVVQAIKRDAIPEYELVKILDVLPIQADTQEFDSEFDLSQELTNQLKALQSIRDRIFSSDGRIKEGSSVKEAKDFMSSSGSLLQMLQKSRSELINIDRMQAIEEATIDTMRELGEDVIDDFSARLKEKLDRIK